MNKIQSLAKTDTADERDGYTMRISRLTIDKLGVKLYDKISAVVAELIANAFDADAENVAISLPLSTALATKLADGTVDEKGHRIEIIDDGYGMSPDEARAFYLVVGKDRREDPNRGNISKTKSRPVMGRKGIGKLAPFGVCKTIEVLSYGGPFVEEKGYQCSHFFLDYDSIVQDDDRDVPLRTGPSDKTFARESGTTIRLLNFNVKHVPDRNTLHRQIATRFVFASDDFKITIKDSRTGEEEAVSADEVAIVESTRIDLSKHPVPTDAGEQLEVKGWLAMARDSYRNEEQAGVRIYARNKIVARTRDFEQPAGFTGEFTVRSYLVGCVQAEWLDEDEDLVRSDRQGILWDSDYGEALKKWGAELIKKIGSTSAEPRRKKKKELFLEKSNFIELVRNRFPSESIQNVAIDLAGKLGAFSAEDELDDPDYVSGLSEIILTVAPHKALIDAFQEFNNSLTKGEETVEQIVDVFDKARISELAMYARIASERVDAIRNLETLMERHDDENEFQKLLADAPWLIEPTWSIISKNQALKTFKVQFQTWWREHYPSDPEITLAIGNEKSRPDFTLISIGRMLHIVEIKKKGHDFNDEDCSRLLKYIRAFQGFFDANPQLLKNLAEGWKLQLVADGVQLKDDANQLAFEGILEKGLLQRITWVDFLTRARVAHEEFLNVSSRED